MNRRYSITLAYFKHKPWSVYHKYRGICRRFSLDKCTRIALKDKAANHSRKWQFIFDFRLYLVHTSLVESHDGGMSQSVKHCPQGLLGVQLLWFEQLLQELLIEHGGNDIIHNYHNTNTERERDLKSISMQIWCWKPSKQNAVCTVEICFAKRDI